MPEADIEKLLACQRTLDQFINQIRGGDRSRAILYLCSKQLQFAKERMADQARLHRPLPGFWRDIKLLLKIAKLMSELEARDRQQEKPKWI